MLLLFVRCNRLPQFRSSNDKLAIQAPWVIELVHENLTHLDLLRRIEALIGEESLDLLNRLTRHAPARDTGLLPSTEELQHLLMIPEHANIIVGLLLAINGSLNRVSVIVDDKDNRCETESNICAYFLYSHLKRAVADDQNHTAGVASLAISDQCTEACADCESDRRPENLRNVAGVGGEDGVADSKLGGTRFSEDDIVRLEKAADTLPDIVLSDDAGF